MMNDFEKLVLEKLDIIIAQTAPKKSKPQKTKEASELANKVLEKFNKYFGKSVGMTAANRCAIEARIKDDMTLEQAEAWFKHASTDKWWVDRPQTANIPTQLKANFFTRLENIGLFDSNPDDDVNDELLEM